MTAAPLVYLSAEDIRRALPMADAVAAVKEAFLDLDRGAVVMPPRTAIASPSSSGARPTWRRRWRKES